MQLVIADQADAANAEPCFAERRFRRFDQRMPVEPDHALALATADQDLEALHRHIEIKCLNSFDGDGPASPSLSATAEVRALRAQRQEAGPLAPRKHWPCVIVPVEQSRRIDKPIEVIGGMSPDQPSGSEHGPPVDSLRSDFQALVGRSDCP